jgi:hypothetical protein
MIGEQLSDDLLNQTIESSFLAVSRNRRSEKDQMKNSF